LSIGYRIPGSQERVNCANYFVSKFQEIDINFTYFLHNFTAYSTECQNLLFKLNENWTNIVILGAHYDSRAKATKDDYNPDDPVPGANDGASGSAVLIELARVLYDKKDDLKCQIWFIFFDAEDQGNDGKGYGMPDWDWCVGSNTFVQVIHNYYNSSKESFECMILLDMVGGDNLKFINELHSISSLLNELFQIGRQLGYTNEFPANPISAYITDDHLAFVNYGIPSVDLIISFWNKNPDWPYHHTTEDNLDHINTQSLKATGDTIEQFILNNYLKNSTYQGNSPWYEDINALPTGVLSNIIISVAIIGSAIAIIIFYAIHQINLKKTKEINQTF